MKKVILIMAMLFTTVLFAEKSEIPYPSKWKEFKSIKTTLTDIGALPDCNADVSSFPKIYQETVSTYCNIKPGGPGKVAILVEGDSLDSYKKRDGKIKDGKTFILHLKDLKALFVTTYKNGEPLYGIYTEDGKDIAAAQGSGLNPQDCRVCHTGYGAFCLNGQCGTLH